MSSTNGEILLASLTAEPERTLGAAALVSVQTAARRADRSAISLRPTDFAEGRLGFLIRHAKDHRQGEGLCFCRKEEMLSHNLVPGV